MSTDDEDIKEVSVCANCGKGEEQSGNLKSCTAVRWLNIAIENVKLLIGLSIRRSVRRRRRNYTMKSYSNNHRQRKIVQSVSNNCQACCVDGDTSHVVEKSYAVDVAMHLYTMTKVMKLIIKSVHSADYCRLLQLRRQMRG